VNHSLRLRRFFCVAAILFSVKSLLSAQTHVAEPVVNLGDTTFLDGVGAPGFLAEQIVDGAYDGRIAGSNGATVHWRIKGPTVRSPKPPCRPCVSALTYASETSTSAPYQAPAMRSCDIPRHVGQAADAAWRAGVGKPQRHLLGMPIDQRIDADFELPVGYYSREPGVNLGSNTFRIHPYYAITAHPAKRTETSWRMHYLWNSENTAPPLSTGASRRRRDRRFTSTRLLRTTCIRNSGSEPTDIFSRR
jgi:hypothetical protein